LHKHCFRRHKPKLNHIKTSINIKKKLIKILARNKQLSLANNVLFIIFLSADFELVAGQKEGISTKEK